MSVSDRRFQCRSIPEIVVLVYIDFFLYFHYFDLCFRLSDIPDVWKCTKILTINKYQTIVVNKEYCLIQFPNCPVPSTEMSRSVPKCPGPSTKMSRYRYVQVPRCGWYHILCLLTEDNDNPIIIRPHIVLTDGRQRQPNHNTTNHISGPGHLGTWTSPICGRIMIGLSLSSVSKHNMWSYYDWLVVVVFRQ
jgi:hypothetical protein